MVDMGEDADVADVGGVGLKSDQAGRWDGGHLCGGSRTRQATWIRCLGWGLPHVRAQCDKSKAPEGQRGES